MAEEHSPGADFIRQLVAEDVAAGKNDGLLEKATSEPGVKKLLREFGAQVLDIRPLEPPIGSDSEP